MPNIRVMTWNLAGAKVLYALDGPPNPAALSYTNAFSDVWRNGIRRCLSAPPHSQHDPAWPDLILLQECIGFRDTRDSPSKRWQTGEEILKRIFENYECFFFPALSSHTHPHPKKWQKVWAGSGLQHFLPDEVEAQQGYGICIRDPNSLRKLWVPDPSTTKADAPHGLFKVCFESIHLPTGAYLGDRDTEPRLLIRGRMLAGVGNDERYINFVNVHLTTLQREREGNIRLNRRGSQNRLKQIEILLDEVVSAYQETEEFRIPRLHPGGRDDIWILGGDFNATPESEEVQTIRRAGLVDSHDGHGQREIVDDYNQHHNQIGTKWSLGKPASPPTIVDYIFCGLESSSFPIGGLTKTPVKPYRPKFNDARFESDHAVMIAEFKVS